MNLNLPRTYQELLDRKGTYNNFKAPKSEEILRDFGYKSISLHAQAPAFYVVDYVQKKYLFIDPACKPMLGYDLDLMLEAGPNYYTKLWHPSDFKIYNNEIFPKKINFLKNLLPHTVQDYSFSFNYRVATKNGDYITVLQRSTYYLSPDGVPLAAVGFIIDISHFKEDTKIIFTIERIDSLFNCLTKEPIHRSVYSPEKDPGVFSRREVQVLQCIYEGLNSKQIADKLFITIGTVYSHRKKMLEKTSCHNTPDLLRYANRHGVL